MVSSGTLLNLSLLLIIGRLLWMFTPTHSTHTQWRIILCGIVCWWVAASAQLRVSKISLVRSWLNQRSTFHPGVAWVWPLVTSPCLPPCPRQPPLFCLPGNSSHESDVTTGKCLVRPGETFFVKLQVLFICLNYESSSNLLFSAFFIMSFFHPKSMFISPGLLSAALRKLICHLFVFLKSHRLCEQSRNVS